MSEIPIEVKQMLMKEYYSVKKQNNVGEKTTVFIILFLINTFVAYLMNDFNRFESFERFIVHILSVIAATVICIYFRIGEW